MKPNTSLIAATAAAALCGLSMAADDSTTTISIIMIGGGNVPGIDYQGSIIGVVSLSPISYHRSKPTSDTRAPTKRRSRSDARARKRYPAPSTTAKLCAPPRSSRAPARIASRPRLKTSSTFRSIPSVSGPSRVNQNQTARSTSTVPSTAPRRPCASRPRNSSPRPAALAPWRRAQ